mmetsp:Transcript_1672/g.2623  ORF Transcript_1672/g.2623 Transcript_1672/m.2623 type:complete len:232 (-) Transcript_1672:387-1082(-)
MLADERCPEMCPVMVDMLAAARGLSCLSEFCAYSALDEANALTVFIEHVDTDAAVDMDVMEQVKLQQFISWSGCLLGCLKDLSLGESCSNESTIEPSSDSRSSLIGLSVCSILTPETRVRVAVEASSRPKFGLVFSSSVVLYFGPLLFLPVSSFSALLSLSYPPITGCAKSSSCGYPFSFGRRMVLGVRSVASLGVCGGVGGCLPKSPRRLDMSICPKCLRVLILGEALSI